MKWKSYKKVLHGNTKTFLVLPLVDDGPSSDSEMNKNPGLRLFTKTWPIKNNGNKDELENKRPLTATLDKPQILDIRLIGKLDMSLLKKECISLNLCRVPLSTVNRTQPRRKTALVERRRPASNLPIALSPTEKSKRLRNDRKSDLSASEDSWESDSLNSSRDSKISSKIRPPRVITTKKLDYEINNNTFKPIRKRKTVTNELSTKPLLPEPCTTCGRPDLPERFHSHPSTPLKPIKKMEPKIPAIKSTVQKPVAMRYKSKLVESKLDERKNSLPAQKLVHTPLKNEEQGDGSSVPVVRIKSSKPRTLTCYLCGREFGTASLPLHEPKCLQKWQRENAALPPNLRRQAPVKPDQPLNQEEWNKFAWEASQSALAPCQNCGRTFYPDRLQVHQRSCKATPGSMKKPITSSEALRNITAPNVAAGAPPLSAVQCSVCGKLFGTKSIKIHEPQCLKKWHVINDHLPADQREPFPTRNVTDDSPGRQRQEKSSPADDVKTQAPVKKSPMFPCYLCGRLFGVSSIYIHEPQCLKKWRIENDKLPANKRRKEPLKPDIKFTPNGSVDYVGTFHRVWENHLNELAQCPKCERTFFPNRIEKHIEACNGLKFTPKPKR